MSDPPETLAALLRRYSHDDDPVEVPRVSFADALRRGDDPLHVLPYLAGLGHTVGSLEQLLLVVNADETEEELHCFRVAEGVAVSMASDGLWLLFEP